MNVRFIVTGFVALCAAIFMPAMLAHAQTDTALINELEKKGVLTEKDAQDIEASEAKSYAETGASKIVLSDAIKTIQFYGDLRLRFEMRDGTTPGGVLQTGSSSVSTSSGLSKVGPDSQTMNRWRYRLRFGAKGDLYDNFFWGIRANGNPTYDRSGNVTFGHSDGAGPFGKGFQDLAIDEVYLGWHATSDITLTGGQYNNPLYTTNLVWDDNINPTGATEAYDHTFGDVELFGSANQWIYQAGGGNGITNTANNGAGTGINYSNTFMYAEQIGFKYKFDKDTFFKMAGTFYTYSGTVGNNPAGGTVAGLYSSTPINYSGANQSPSYFNGPFVGAASAPISNVSGINDLAVLEVPMEFDFKIGPGMTTTSSGDPKDMKDVTTTTSGWSVPIRIFADFAYNTEADERANAARGAIEQIYDGGTYLGSSNLGVTSAGTTTNNVTTAAQNKAMINSPTFQGVLNSGKGLLDQSAYQIGFEAGQLKHKGDWDGKLYWQSTGYYAVDPNLVDADIFNAATNLNGVVASVSHNWTEGLSSTIRYAYATPVNGQLATPSVNQDLQIGDIRNYQVLQLDVMWKF
ncbi:MAG: putative porin [Methylacidiphilales bacterium]|nr:putative porin [Candidatus Methylacidiphilales bacterium]